MLSEHQCEGWLEGYLLTGRHGLFNSYEAFIRIVESMFSQHAKWLKVTLELPWRRKIASLNYLLASHVWQQDHNGFTHQDPGFLDHVINKKADIVRVYLPPDANCLLSTFDHCLRSRHYVNVVIAGKHPLPQWLTMDEAVVHCTQGLGITSLLAFVPASVAGIAFLSGGQSSELASARLNAINLNARSAAARAPWPLVFSFTRAIQEPALEIWRGQENRVSEAQHALAHQAL